jgi:hypothetical protein
LAFCSNVFRANCDAIAMACISHLNNKGMDAVCSSKISISNSSVHGLITQMTRIWLPLMTVTQKTDGFCNVTPCSMVYVEVDRHFSRTCCSIITVDDTASHPRRQGISL